MLQIEVQESIMIANQDQTKDKELKEQAGRVQLEFWCKEKKFVLVVSILAADNLPLREDYYFGGSLPEAFIRLRLLPAAYVLQILMDNP